MPRAIVAHNSPIFKYGSFKNICMKWKINLKFAAIAHPESNSQANAANKAILIVLKKRIVGKKGTWAKEIPEIIWYYKTTHKEVVGETPFRKAYGAKATIPLEVQMSYLRL